MKVIVNPVAANGAVGRRWPRIRQFLLEQGAHFDAELTRAPGHATELAREAVAQGYETIVCVGGDGTLNEVLNGLVTEKGVEPVSLGIIPGGTGSDFRRTVGIPPSYQEACLVLLEGHTRLVDIGEITCLREGEPVRRYFVNVAGVGFDGEVADRTNRLPKVLGGTLPYLASLFITLVAYRNKDVVTSFDGQSIRHRVNAVVVSNGQFFGGGMHIAPEASPDDGFFDIIVLGDLGKLELVANIPRVYKGTHLTHPKVSSYRAREVRVEAKGEERMFIQADGEFVGQAPTTFRLLPRALKVLVKR